MLFPPIDPNARFRERRASARRRKRLRRGALVGALLAAVTLIGAGAQFVSGDAATRPAASQELRALGLPETAADGPRPLPVEVRGVHLTMGLLSLPGKLQEYLALTQAGLTALEVDVKDENGQVGFVPRRVPLATRIGAAREYYSVRQVARLVHERGLYLVGRVVVFEDPILSHTRPELAVQRRDGAVWRDAAGLGWTNPYDRRVWEYNVAVAVAAARAGFDEIMFDYVRFPSDGDVAGAVYRNDRGLAKRETIPAFLRYASGRLKPLGVRVSAAVFGLSAARDLGIGQLPGRMAPYLDSIYPMTYPSHFGAGELGISDPSAYPGETVSRALKRFERRLRGRDVLVLPWVQDFSLPRPYGLDEVRAQIEAARLSGAKGFMLWNPQGVYTDGALVSAS